MTNLWLLNKSVNSVSARFNVLNDEHFINQITSSLHCIVGERVRHYVNRLRKNGCALKTTSVQSNMAVDLLR